MSTQLTLRGGPRDGKTITIPEHAVEIHVPMLDEWGDQTSVVYDATTGEVLRHGPTCSLIRDHPGLGDIIEDEPLDDYEQGW